MKKNTAIGIITFLFVGSLTSSAQTVMLDYYFNHEVHMGKSGANERFHYMWEDQDNTGFSIFGDAFKRNGVHLKSLDTSPNSRNLRQADIYIIVDPDTRKESPYPNYIQEKDINEITRWVKAGGVLVMFANDSANVELPHFNNLAAKFGMHFNDDLQNHVVDDDHFDDGGTSTQNNPLFETARLIFMKDVCSIATNHPAYPLLKNKNNATIIALAKYGKGTVLAVGDPWLYNEYTNGRLPPKFENDKAADDLVKWLIKQTQIATK